MTIEMHRVFLQADNCLLETMDDDILLYNPDNATTLHLNESSALIWQLIDGERNVTEMIELLQESYPEASEQIKVDVLELLAKMLNNGVVVAGDS